MRTGLAAGALAAAMMLLGVNAPAHSAGVQTLGDCYNVVIAACNKKKNDAAAAACANSGMDQCDKQFGQSATPIDPGVLNGLRRNALKNLAANG